jgi:N-acetylglucosamine-6-phosphate deacetylase
MLAVGPVGYVTLARSPGALELVDLPHERGIVVSCGHSDAIRSKLPPRSTSVGTVTHLNAMRPLTPRPGDRRGCARARRWSSR